MLQRDVQLNAVCAAHADHEALLTLLVRGLNDAHLQRLASADYGNGQERHLALLRQLCAGNYVLDLRQHAMYPLEVLELTRWIEPEEGQTRHGLNTEEQHRLRAFSCAVILHTAGWAWPSGRGYVADGSDSIIQLLRSVRVLGPAYQQAAMALLCWRFQEETQALADQLCQALAILVLWLELDSVGAAWPVEELATWILAAEAEWRADNPQLQYTTGWFPHLQDSLRSIEWSTELYQLAACLEAQQLDPLSALFELMVCCQAHQ